MASTLHADFDERKSLCRIIGLGVKIVVIQAREIRLNPNLTKTSEDLLQLGTRNTSPA